MKKLTLKNPANRKVTVLENEFIDRYMPRANGEYVKVYLLLLRHLDESASLPAPSKLADLLDCTEKDILRALNYWEKEGLLECPDAQVTASQAALSKNIKSEAVPVAVPAAAPEEQIAPEENRPKSREEFQELMFVAEQYLGKTLSVTDIDAISYFYEKLEMSADLIEYLLGYCIESGHKSIHYIQKVALSWHEQGIATVEQAKMNSVLYNKNCYSILNAYGIKGRGPASSEMTYIRKWCEEYAFSLEIILEACDRTMNMIHQPSFEYTDSILTNWHKKDVHTLEDISVLDAQFTQARITKAAAQPERSSKPAGKNRFNNFENRSYDMNDLERRLIQQ